MDGKSNKRSRWGARPTEESTVTTATSVTVSEDQAMAALLESAQKHVDTKKVHSSFVPKKEPNKRQRQQHNSSNNKQEVEDELVSSDNGKISTATTEKEKANFGLSGALAPTTTSASATNVKYSEPMEARIPNTRWRLYVFRTTNNKEEEEEELMEILHVSSRSCYVFGRDATVCSIPLHHPSLSKQHCVLQYRATPSTAAANKSVCKPYLMDLESTNGTFLNGLPLEPARYYELKKGDVIRLGGSRREFVVLTEHTTQI